MQIVYVRVSPTFIDLTGKRFGRLIALRYVGLSNHQGHQRKARWECRCDCGNKKIVVSQNLRKGHTRSCGCLFIEMLKARAKHNARHTPEYDSWSHAIQRCENKKNTSWPDYGGRGIKICKEWRHDFKAFLKHVGLKPSKHHSLDRINNDSDYEPGNVRWSTQKEQNGNKRKKYGKSLRRHKAV